MIRLPATVKISNSCTSRPVARPQPVKKLSGQVRLDGRGKKAHIFTSTAHELYFQLWRHGCEAVSMPGYSSGDLVFCRPACPDFKCMNQMSLLYMYTSGWSFMLTRYAGFPNH